MVRDGGTGGDGARGAASAPGVSLSLPLLRLRFTREELLNFAHRGVGDQEVCCLM